MSPQPIYLGCILFIWSLAAVQVSNIHSNWLLITLHQLAFNLNNSNELLILEQQIDILIKIG